MRRGSPLLALSLTLGCAPMHRVAGARGAPRPPCTRRAGPRASRDLARWREGPLAIAPWVDPEDPRRSEMVFSGSAVLDAENVSGLGRDGAPALLAFYTSAYSWVTPARGQQAISVAVSLDGGETFTRYPGNPVVAIPPGNAERVDGNEFRDPKVFWHAPSERWIMLVALAADRRIRFLSSQDLLHWSHLSDFGPANSYAGIWEVPDLFELPPPRTGRPGSTGAWTSTPPRASTAPPRAKWCGSAGRTTGSTRAARRRRAFEAR